MLNPSLVLSFPCGNVSGMISSMVLACRSSPRMDLKVTVHLYKQCSTTAEGDPIMMCFHMSGP